MISAFLRRARRVLAILALISWVAGNHAQAAVGGTGSGSGSGDVTTAALLSASNGLYYAIHSSNVVRFTTNTWTQTGFSNAFWNLDNNGTILLDPGVYPVGVKFPPDGVSFSSAASAGAAFKCAHKTNIALIGVGGLARFIVTNEVTTSPGDVFWTDQLDRLYVENIAIERPVKPTYSAAFAVDWNYVQCMNGTFYRCVFKNGSNHGLCEQLGNSPGRISSNTVVIACHFEGYGATNWIGSGTDGAAMELAGPTRVLDSTFLNCYRGYEIEGDGSNGTQDTLLIEGCTFIDCWEWAIGNLTVNKGQRTKIKGNIFRRVSDTPPTGYGLYAIWLQTPSVDWEIEGNTFERVGYGIYGNSSGWTGLRIRGNYFATNYLAITLAPGGANTNSTGLNITGNQLFGCTNGITVTAWGGVIAHNTLVDVCGYVSGNAAPIQITKDTNGSSGRIVIEANTIVGNRTSVTGSYPGIYLAAGVSNCWVNANLVDPPLLTEVWDSGTSNVIYRAADSRRWVNYPITINATNNTGTNRLLVIGNYTDGFQVVSNGSVLLIPDATTGNGPAFSNVVLHLSAGPAVNGREAISTRWSCSPNQGSAPSFAFQLDAGFTANANGSNFWRLGVRDVNGVYQPRQGFSITGDGRFYVGTNDGPAAFNVFNLTTTRPAAQYMISGGTTNIVEFADGSRAIKLAVRYDGAIVEDTTNNVIRCNGNGSPEGVVTAGVGSEYKAVGAAAGSRLWLKTNGTGNTGWWPYQ